MSTLFLQGFSKSYSKSMVRFESRSTRVGSGSKSSTAEVAADKIFKRWKSSIHEKPLLIPYSSPSLSTCRQAYY